MINDFLKGWNEGKAEALAMASDPKQMAELDEARRVTRKYRVRADLMELFKDNPDQDNLLKELDQALLKV